MFLHHYFSGLELFFFIIIILDLCDGQISDAPVFFFFFFLRRVTDG